MLLSVVNSYLTTVLDAPMATCGGRLLINLSPQVPPAPIAHVPICLEVESDISRNEVWKSDNF